MQTDTSQGQAMQNGAEPRKARATITVEDFCTPEILSALMHKIGHEIGNPLTSIISLAAIVSRFSTVLPGGENKAAHYANSISSEAWKINRITEMLVMLYSQQPGSALNCEINQIIDKALSKLKTRTNLDTDSVIIQIDRGASVKAHIDPEQCTALLAELLANALQASFIVTATSGTSRSPVVVTVSNRGSATLVEVRNVAAQRNTHELSELFTPLVTTFQAQRHLGIGLSMAAAIVARFAGWLEVEERPLGIDGACEFVARVALPQAQGVSVPPEVLDRAKPAKAGKNSAAVAADGLPETLRVLIVEDQPSVSSAIRKILEFYYRSKTALECVCTTGKDAVQRLENGEQFQAILCDLNLSGMHGKHVFEAVLKHQPACKNCFAYMTGGPQPSGAGPDKDCPCLTKPFEPEQLLALVQQLIQTKSNR